MDFSGCFREKDNVALACFSTVFVSAGVVCPYSRRDAVLTQEKCNQLSACSCLLYSRVILVYK